MDPRTVQQFKKGSLEMVLLSLIAGKETYGYELITELKDKGAAVLGYAREGTIYPILYRLQDAGLIQCRIAPAAANGGSKKYYSITEKFGCPELCGVFCDYERAAFGGLRPQVEFECGGMLANGHEFCDFRFIKGSKRSRGQ